MKMKKIITTIFSTFMVVALVGCGGSKETTSNKNAKQLSKIEFEQMYSDINKFKGDKVDFFAKIFINPEKDSKGIYIQCFANNNDKLNTVVALNDTKLDIKQDDIIHVVGTVKDKFEGENALGGKVSAPLILAEKVEKTDYAKAFAPAVKTIKVDKEINQNGYIIKLNSVEIAEKETRVNLTITNNSNNKINFYAFNSKLTQGSKQIPEAEKNFDAKYKEIQSEIMPGVKEDGVVVFKEIDLKGDTLKFNFEGASDNYELQFKPFVFEVSLK